MDLSNDFAWFKEEDFLPLQEQRIMEEEALLRKRRKVEQENEEKIKMQEMTPDERREYLLQKEEQKKERRKKKTLEKLEKIKENVENTGVVYMSWIPPTMNAGHLRMLLMKVTHGSTSEEKPVEIGRIRMHVESPHERNVRHKKGGTWQRCGKEAWIEFGDKKEARLVAESLNGTPMGKGAGDKFRQCLWNLKYLPKFKWHHLLEQDQYLKIERQKQIETDLRVKRKSNEEFKQLSDQSWRQKKKDKKNESKDDDINNNNKSEKKVRKTEKPENVEQPEKLKKARKSEKTPEKEKTKTDEKKKKKV